MSITGTQVRQIYEALLQAYDDVADLGIVLELDLQRSLDDVSPPDRTRKRRVLDVVTKARTQGWVKELITAVLGDPDQSGNDLLRDALIPILVILEPEPGVPAHEHLTTDGVAFANRSTLRQIIGDMTSQNGPRVLVLRGDTLCGTSYAWRLINHVARDGAIERVTIDFDLFGDHSPFGVIRALAAEMQIAASPERADDPSQEQLTIYFVRWLAGYLRNSEKDWWIVFDNAQRPAVPKETKEMIIAFAQHFASGAVDTARLFVLGFDAEIAGIGAPYANDVPLTGIGQPEVLDYLMQVTNKLGDLPGFASAEEAADEVLSGIDLNNPTRELLTSVSEQLTHIISEMRQ